MDKLQFDTHGNPKPYDIVKLTYDKCKSIFVDNFTTSKTRGINWNNFRAPLKTQPNEPKTKD